MSFVSYVCFQAEVSAKSWSLVQRSPTDCGASLCVLWKSCELGDRGPLGAVGPKEWEGGGRERVRVWNQNYMHE